MQKVNILTVNWIIFSSQIGSTVKRLLRCLDPIGGEADEGDNSEHQAGDSDLEDSSDSEAGESEGGGSEAGDFEEGDSEAEGSEAENSDDEIDMQVGFGPKLLKKCHPAVLRCITAASIQHLHCRSHFAEMAVAQ